MGGERDARTIDAEVPDLNAQYRAERAMRDLTWGPGRTIPEVPQMTQPSYRACPGQRAPGMDRMRDNMLYQQQPVPAPDVEHAIPAA